MILNCSCQNDYMDRKYGKNRRVCNKTTKEKTYRCASCSKEQNGPK